MQISEYLQKFNKSLTAKLRMALLCPCPLAPREKNEIIFFSNFWSPMAGFTYIYFLFVALVVMTGSIKFPDVYLIQN